MFHYRLRVSYFLLQHDENVIGAAHGPMVTQFPQRLLHQQEPEADYIFKSGNFTRQLARAESNNDYGRIESEPFFSSHGYKMKFIVNATWLPRLHGCLHSFNEK